MSSKWSDRPCQREHRWGEASQWEACDGKGSQWEKKGGEEKGSRCHFCSRCISSEGVGCYVSNGRLKRVATQRGGGRSPAPPLSAATVGLTPTGVQQPHGLATTARRWGSTCTRWRRRAEPNLSSSNSLPLWPANRRDPRSGAAAGSAEELAVTSSVRPTAGSGTGGLACPPPSWVRAEPEAAPVLRGNGVSHHTLSLRGEGPV